MNKRPKLEAAFTLIELLMVIAIIAILAALNAPVHESQLQVPSDMYAIADARGMRDPQLPPTTTDWGERARGCGGGPSPIRIRKASLSGTVKVSIFSSVMGA